MRFHGFHELHGCVYLPISIAVTRLSTVFLRLNRQNGYRLNQISSILQISMKNLTIFTRDALFVSLIAVLGHKCICAA